MERFIVWTAEQSRRLLRPGVETDILIYDMAGAGMKNVVRIQLS